ncbi:migration and invasion-inhibitory protein isoform X2 [Rhineura floridana]|uniref:migration and invasion-inhibitory protein isoform X2 n=1 Tax=Rhineura floridana TaxID=261503 RepID=UPI002AC866D4|nr:migration and invasion-inhibitory protein isoform X2 [Rhineura floridana]
MDLESLRHVNQELLQTLRKNQEAFKKRIHAKLLTPSSPSKRAAPRGMQVSHSEDRRENGDHFPKDETDSLMTVSTEGGSRAARLGLGCPLKPIKPHDQRGRHHQGHSRPARGAKAVRVLSAAATTGSPRATCKTVNSGEPPRGQRKPSVPACHAEATRHSAYLHDDREMDRPRAGEEANQAQAGESSRTRTSAHMLQTPKSILLTPEGKESKEKLKRESGHVTFMSDPEEYAIPADGWSVRPFLGYDWIAGLLDMDSSMSEKPDEYFSELQEFRQVNREACIYNQDLRPERLRSAACNYESDMDIDPASHQCIYCYRLNKRLFAVPLDSEPTCPVCKTPRAQQPPETLVEPSFVRVSIPRSTLLPAYKHKIHRRKSYEPADNLALPSHCLAGLENPLRAFSPTLSSLDLRSSVGGTSPGRTNRSSVSRVAGGTRTDELLDLSRVAEFEVCNLSRQGKRHKPPCCKATSN